MTAALANNHPYPGTSRIRFEGSPRRCECTISASQPLPRPAGLVRALGVPESWQLVAYLCVGLPQEEHQDCELERVGWERRRRLDGKLIRV